MSNVNMVKKTSRKYELLDELFRMGGNYKPEEAKLIKAKLQEFAKDNEGDLQISDALIILKISEVERKYSDLKTCCALSIPIFERLKQMPEWDFYDIRILAAVINFAESYEQTHIFATKALKKLKPFSLHERYIFIKLAILMNSISRFVKARFFKESSHKSDEYLEEIFRNYIAQITPLCKGSDFIFYQAVLSVRKGLFYRDIKLINISLDILRKNGEEEAYNLLKDEIGEYNLPIKLDNINANQLNKIIGANIKNIRKSYNLPIERIASILNESVYSLDSIESGKKSLTLHSVYKLSEALNIPIDVFCFGIEESLFDLGRKKELTDKINTITGTLEEDKLEHVLTLLESLSKLP